MLSAFVFVIRRQVCLRSLYLPLLVFALAVSCTGATLNLGVLSYDLLIPGDGTLPGVTSFNIANLTLDPVAGGFALPPDFPVYSLVLFQDVVLRLVTATSLTTISLGDLPPGFFSTPELEFPEDTVFLEAEFSAKLSAKILTLDDSSVLTATSTQLSAILLPANGSSLVAGSDLVVIQTAATGEVPETASWLLVAAGLVLLCVLRSIRLRRRPLPMRLERVHVTTNFAGPGWVVNWVDALLNRTGRDGGNWSGSMLMHSAWSTRLSALTTARPLRAKTKVRIA
jgi:hypothetical protein